MEKVEAWIEVASELNLAWFFLRGGFFDLGKRIAGVGYVSPCVPDFHFDASCFASFQFAPPPHPSLTLHSLGFLPPCTV